jgi:hypothetical protein
MPGPHAEPLTVTVVPTVPVPGVIDTSVSAASARSANHIGASIPTRRATIAVERATARRPIRTRMFLYRRDPQKG